MAPLSSFILRDTRANQPAASIAGRLYYVTDENVTERDSGSAWEDVSDAGGGGGTPTARVRAYHNTNQATTSGTPLALALNSERWDTDTCHDNSVNNSRLTCHTTGHYTMGAGVLWATGFTAARVIVWILLNGTTTLAEMEIGVGNSGTNAEFVLSTAYDLTSGDYIEVMVFQNSGSPQNVISTGNHSPEFWMTQVQ